MRPHSGRAGWPEALPRTPWSCTFGFAKALTYILWPGYILGRIGRVLKRVYVDHFGHVTNQDYIQAIVLNRNCVRIHVCDHMCHILR